MRPFSPPLPPRSVEPNVNDIPADEVCSSAVTAVSAESGGAVAYGTRFMLPMDILFLVFVECNAVTLARCRKVCRSFNTFINNQRTLLYKLALAFERQVDTSQNDYHIPATPQLTSMQKLQKLRRQGLAWRGELPPAMKIEIPVSRPDSIYELNGGVFALGDANGGSTGTGTSAFPGLEPPSTIIDNNRLDFVKLPSVISGNLRAEWGHINLGTRILVEDFTMNVEVDLLVLIERKMVEPDSTQTIYRVHLMSLSRSAVELEPHPHAQVPVLEYPGHPDWAGYQTDCEMNGDHLGLLLNSGQPMLWDRLVVWDWKKGNKAAMHAGEEAFESFVFVREGLVLVPSFKIPSLNLFSYTLEEGVGSFQRILSFKLPSPANGLVYLYMMLRTQTTGHPSYNYDDNITPKKTHAVPPTTTINPDTSEEKDRSGPPQHTPGILEAPFSPFSSSIDEAIVVVSLAVVPAPGNNAWANRFIPDREGTLVISKSTFWKWLRIAEKEAIALKCKREKEEAVKFTIDVNENAEAVMAEVPPNDSARMPLHRSQGVQTSPEPLSPDSTQSSSYPKVIPWSVWMYETRWLRDKQAPRWIRDVYGTRFASRVLSMPYLLPPALHPPAGAYQSGAIGDLPTIGQLLNSYDTNDPAGSISSATNTPPVPVPPPPATLPTILPSISGLFNHQPIINSTDFALMPLPTPVGSPLELQAAIVDAVENPRYRTRICDFSRHAYHRVPRSFPYPGNVKLDLTVDYTELQLPKGSTGLATPTEENPLPELTDVQTSARWSARYLKKKKKQEGEVPSDRGWSVIRNEVGLEWIRRPVFEDTVIPAGITFAERISTGMPYLEITNRISNDCTALMIDAERVIGMNTEDGNLTSIQVLVV